MNGMKYAALTVALAVTAANLPQFPVASAENTIYINEVCTQNKSTLTDAYGGYSDWIELYNAGTAAVDLSGYGLSDDATQPRKWVFPPNTTLGAKEYRIVFASKNASTADKLHTGFALSKNGETLTLSRPDGATLEQIEIPTLGEDVTYGRMTDGSGTFEIMPATPGTANAAVASAPAFSAQSGFYGTDFALRLSAADDAEIFYTMDGSDPTTSSTAQKYTAEISVTDRTNQPNLYSNYAEDENSAVSVSRGCGYQKPSFSVDKATVVRAAAKKADGTFSAIADRTYFVTTGNLAQYKNGTVISLVANPDDLFDPDTGIYVTGNQYLDWKNSGSYNAAKSPWDTDNVCNFFSRGKDWERQASVTIFEDGAVSATQGMGMRIKGASTRNSPQKSFNLYARSEYGASKIETALLPENNDISGNLIDTYDSISLRSVPEEVRLRDSFAQGLIHHRTQLTTADMKPCIVFLNGEYWGLYQITEKLSDDFIQTNYGIAKKDVTMIKSGEMEEGTQEECDRFFAFADQYSEMDLTNAANYQAVCDFVDLDSMIEHYAAGLYFGTFDWPNYNYGVWKSTGAAIDGNPYSDGKWRFITYDMDYTMGATYASFGNVEGYAYDSFQHMNRNKGEAPTNLFIRLLKNETFRNWFANVYCDYANEVLSTERVKAQAEKFSSAYSDLLANTTLRWWGFYGGTPNDLIPYYKRQYQNETLRNIQTFFAQRPGYTLEDMRTFLGVGGALQSLTLSANGAGNIQVNSIIPSLSGGSWSGSYLSSVPVTLTALPTAQSAFSGWSGAVESDSATITVTLSEAMSITANFTEKTTLAGDVNADGSRNVADAIALQRYLLRDGVLADAAAGDLNADKRVDAFDLTALKRLLLGK